MAIHIDRVYTRGGDEGETSLVGGSRVPKDSLRIEAYGTLDELGAGVGLARALADGNSFDEEVDALLEGVQNDLFNAGSQLATPPEARRDGAPAVDDEDVSEMEASIDRLGQELEPLRSFVLAGGGPVGTALHQARTVCRRSERVAVALAREEEVEPIVIRYLNRLSDLLFVVARVVAHRGGHTEVLWKEGLGPPKEDPETAG